MEERNAEATEAEAPTAPSDREAGDTHADEDMAGRNDGKRLSRSRNFWVGVAVGILVVVLVVGMFALGFGVGRWTARTPEAPGERFDAPLRGEVRRPPVGPGQTDPKEPGPELSPEGQREVPQ